MPLDKYKTPPQAPPSFAATKESIMADTKALCEKNRSLLDKLVAEIPANDSSKTTFDTVILPQALDENETWLAGSILQFFSSVSADSELRHASTEAEKYMNEFSIEMSMREDVFRIVEAVYNAEGGKEGVAAGGSRKLMDPESARLLEREYKGYIKNGLGLPAGPKRDRFKEIKKRLSQLQTDFQKNLNEENGGIWFTKEELLGVPDDVVDNLQKGSGENEGKLRLTFKYPDMIPTMKFAQNAETRRKVFIGNENRVPANKPLFKEAIILRDEAARMLGYPNWAALRIEDKMSKTPKTVDFIEALPRNASGKILRRHLRDPYWAGKDRQVN